MGFEVPDNQPEYISDVLGTGDYVRVMGNGSDNLGRIKAINPEIVLLKPHIKQQPHGDYESVDKPKQVPIPGHTIEEITQEHYDSFEKTHVVNNYLDQPVHVQGQGLTTTGILKSFYMNQMTFKPYLGVSADGSRELVDKQFKREYKEGLTIEPVPKDILRSE
jgi:hypothetical protein